jgi:hypothetical protein
MMVSSYGWYVPPFAPQEIQNLLGATYPFFPYFPVTWSYVKLLAGRNTQHSKQKK